MYQMAINIDKTTAAIALLLKLHQQPMIFNHLLKRTILITPVDIMYSLSKTEAEVQAYLDTQILQGQLTISYKL